MKVSISFSAKSERQKNKTGSINIEVSIREELDRRVVEKTMSKYGDTLKEKFIFEKIVIRKPSLYLYEFICQPNRQMGVPPSQESFINYLSFIGFVGVNNLEEFEVMENNRLLTIFNGYSAKVIQEQSFKKYVSRKSFMDKKEFNRLYQKLLITRDTIEQLTYTTEHTVDWFEKISDCDIILDHINDFYWDMGFFIFIDIKVKKELRYFSDFYDNMKESHLLTEN